MAEPLKLQIGQDLLRALERAAWKAMPEEACALLLGTGEGAVTQVAFAENVTEGNPCTSFEIDPTVHILFQKAARAGGPEIIGVWHSHPDGAPKPSVEDRNSSMEPGWIWLITACDGDKYDHGVFRAGSDDPHQFLPLCLEILDRQ